MGVSTDAILTFGIDLNDELPAFLTNAETEEEHDDLDDFLAHEAGLTDWRAEGHYEKKRALVESCPVEIVRHCSGEYTMYILAVRGTVRTAYRGHLTEIDPTSLVVSPEKIVSFKKWCEDHGVEYQEPKWFLVSFWN